jgi:hypothetical protein
MNNLLNNGSVGISYATDEEARRGLDGQLAA